MGLGVLLTYQNIIHEMETLFKAVEAGDLDEVKRAIDIDRVTPTLQNKVASWSGLSS